MSDEERNICVVVVLWQVLDATRGRVMTPSRVVTVYIYLSIGAHFAAWTPYWTPQRSAMECGSGMQRKLGATCQRDNEKPFHIGRRDAECGGRALHCLQILATILSR